MIGYFYTITTYTKDVLVESQKTVSDIIGNERNSRGILFSPLCSYLGPIDDETHEMSILASLPEEALESAVIFSPVRYFCDSYGAAFLIHIYNAIAKDGWIAVPYYPDKKAQSTGFWNLAWLESILGKPFKLLEDKQIALFSRTITKVMPPSVLSFFMQEGSACALDFFRDRTRVTTESYMKRCKGFIIPPILPLIEETATGNSHVDLEEEQALFFSNMNYSVTGAAYKVAGLRQLLERYIPERENIRVVDIGGGAGFVGIELLLTSSRLSHLVNCEPMSGNVPLVRRLYHWFEPYLKDRYKMCACVVQDYPFDEPIDMICAFASLLYIPRSRLEDTLMRAWNALRPGGIFVIHENIKRPCFEAKNYHNQMFSVEELEGYLSRFGDIDYYRSSDIQPMTRENTQDLTVFRVLQKGIN